MADFTTDNTQTEQAKKPKSRGFLKKYLPLILVLLVIVLGLTSAYFYKKSTSKEDAAQAEVKSLVQKVGKIAVLPTDETPTVATVSDPEALKGQVFFVDAKKGDKVLIYSNAKKAILFDPVQNKIINIAPLSVGTTTQQTATTPTTDKKATDKKN